MYLTIDSSNIKPYTEKSSSSNQAFGMRQNITGPEVLAIDVIEIMLGKRFNMGRSSRIDLCKAMTERDIINPYEYPKILNQCKTALETAYPKVYKKIVNSYIKIIKAIDGNSFQNNVEEQENWIKIQARKYFPEDTITVPKINV